MHLSTIGYGRWPTRQRLAALLQALTGAGITTLVDIRHAPCAASLAPQSNYGPRDWHLHPGSSGIAHQVERQGMEYLWLVELGNPQKQDPAMAVLRAQLASADEKWPVNRGLTLLLQLVQTAGKCCCLLCACKTYDTCHRKLIAESLRTRWRADTLVIRDLA